MDIADVREKKLQKEMTIKLFLHPHKKHILLSENEVRQRTERGREEIFYKLMN